MFQPPLLDQRCWVWRSAPTCPKPMMNHNSYQPSITSHVISNYGKFLGGINFTQRDSYCSCSMYTHWGSLTNAIPIDNNHIHAHRPKHSAMVFGAISHRVLSANGLELDLGRPMPNDIIKSDAVALVLCQTRRCQRFRNMLGKVVSTPQAPNRSCHVGMQTLISCLHTAPTSHPTPSVQRLPSHH